MLGHKNVSARKTSEYTFRGLPIQIVKQSGPPFRGLVKKGMEKGIFPKEKEIEAATIFAVTGDAEQTCKLTGIEPVHFKKLKNSEGFLELLKEIRQENSGKFEAKFTAIVQKAQENLLERLENGDVKVLKDGSQVRVPVSTRDLALVGAINFDKLQLLQGKPTTRTEKVSTNDRLAELADKFIQITQKQLKNTRPPEVIDAEIVEK